MNTTSYKMKVSVRWSDIDPNGHLRHSVYYDYGAQARIEILHQQGINMKYMSDEGFGPILFREECQFKREIRFGDDLEVKTALSGLRKDGSRFSVIHHILRGKEICAILQLDGAWIDTSKRKLQTPPPRVMEAFENWPKSEDFSWI